MTAFRRRRLDEARLDASAVAKAWQLTPAYEQRSADGLVVTVCTLLEAGRAVAVGMGKGDGARAEAGSLFEALERLVMARPEGDVARRPIADVVAQHRLAAPDLVRRVATTHPDAHCLVRTYDGPGGSVEYPAALLNPFVAEREAADETWAADYLRYSSSVGTAAGSDRSEATLHGLFELIEHDAVSLSLLGWFAAEDAPVRLVDPRTSPDEIEARRASLAERTGRELLLVDVTSDLAVPVFMAVLDGVADGAGVVGSGASLSTVDAATSALDEVEQLWAFHGSETDEVPSEALAAWPALSRCQRMAVTDLRVRGVTSDWPTTRDPSDGGDVDRALDHVRRTLRDAGISSFTSLLTSPDQDRLAVVSCLAPGLERFSIVRHGHPVVPAGRGRPIWDRALASRADG